MQKDIQNKSMQSEKVKTKEAYFFPGGGEFEPVSIEAGSQKEALEIYEKNKKLINK